MLVTEHRHAPLIPNHFSLPKQLDQRPAFADAVRAVLAIVDQRSGEMPRA